jgi:hypothetical protein
MCLWVIYKKNMKSISRDMDPWIRIHTKMSQIPNTGRNSIFNRAIVFRSLSKFQCFNA